MDDHIKVTASYLQKLWESEHPDEEELQKYFDVDYTNPFASELKLKQNVQIVDESDAVQDLGLALDLFNWRSRKKRKQRYEEFIRLHSHTPRIVSEGDSWFQHPLVTDTIDHLLKYYPVFSIGAAGDTLRNMHHKGEWLKSIQKIKPNLFLLSAGGNDILGEQFKDFLVEYTNGHAPGEHPERFMNQRFHDELETLKKIYTDVFETLKGENPDLPVIVHGYDYVIPNNPNVPGKWYQSKDKSWLGDYMIKKGIVDIKDKQSIIAYVLNLFNNHLSNLDDMFSQVHYVDLRHTIREDQWHDEIHPNRDGYQQVALKIREKIREII